MDNTIAKLLDLFKHISRDIMIYAISGFVVIVNFFIIDKFYLAFFYLSKCIFELLEWWEQNDHILKRGHKCHVKYCLFSINYSQRIKKKLRG